MASGSAVHDSQECSFAAAEGTLEIPGYDLDAVGRAEIRLAAACPTALHSDSGPQRGNEVIGTTIDRYHVVEKIGQGGMGVIYRAQDTLLGRSVALKVLPSDKIADHERRERFFLEAKSASALNHPGIVTVYDVLNIDGQDVLVMELVEGQTLEEVLAGKRLGLGQALTLAISIGEQPETVEDVYEPFLITQGMIARTPRGRVALAAAYEHVGIRPPAGERSSEQRLFGA